MSGPCALNQNLRKMLHCHTKLLLVCTFISFCYGCPGNFTSVTFYEGFTKRYGESNIFIQDNGNSVYMSLKNRTGGAGFISQHEFRTGLFSASIKLPSQNYTAGVVVSFYLSNNEQNETQHDEIDFEFLGHIENQDWILQTNLYGNGSTARGREERYKLWFDPSKEAHRYSIFYDEKRVMFYVDDVPIRVVQRVEGMGGDYPSKPMFLYASIWDGSGWATGGGRYKINHTFDPFVAVYSNLVIETCSFDLIRRASYCGGSGELEICGEMTPKELGKYKSFRKKYMVYSYCDDKVRYSTPLPECLVSPI